MSKIIVIDTETTGFDPRWDEVLQVGITDENGNILFNEYFKPEHKTEWKEAELVNGISPAFVQNKPLLIDRLDIIQRIFREANTIVGYNTNFDLRFLANTGLMIRPDAQIVDVMLSFAPIGGVLKDHTSRGRTYKGFKCQKLTVAAAHYNYDWAEYGKHDAIGDAKATAFVFSKIREERPDLLSPEEWVRPDGEERE